MYKLLCLLVGYLFISSTLMGFFVLEKENQNINSLANIDYKGNLIKMDGSIPLDMFIDTEYSTNNLRFVNLTGYAGNADNLAQRDVHVDVLQVMHFCAANKDFLWLWLAILHQYAPCH